MWLLEDPGVGHVGHFLNQGQVVSPEAVRILPLVVAVLVEPADGDIVPSAVLGIVFPDCSFDPAQSDLVNGLVTSCHDKNLQRNNTKWGTSNGQCEQRARLGIRVRAIAGEGDLASNSSQCVDQSKDVNRP